MKNRKIYHAREEVKIYENYYKPSFNLWLFFKSIFGVLLFGRSSVAHSFVPMKKRALR
ncbi:MAG: hypothetical protein M3413_01375 [Bacteroidota bacterium]|nr:hypothetical protein [Bacteroidota bacterium]